MTTYSNVEIEGFRNNLVNVPQQLKSRLLPSVRSDLNDTEVGLGFSVDIELGGEGPKVNATKGAPIDYRETGQKRRYAAFEAIDDYFHVQKDQVIKLISDPTQRKMADFMAKKEVRRDVDILKAITGDALETNSSGVPNVTVALPATQLVAVDYRGLLHDTEKSIVATSGNLGLTIGKFIKAVELLNASELVGEKYCALSARLISQLLATTAATSGDFAQYKNQMMALASGELNEFLGVKVIRYEKLTTVSSIVDVPFWINEAIEYRERPLVNVSIDTIKNMRGHPTQFYYEVDRAAVRVHDTGVVLVKAHQDRQIAA